MSVDSYTIQDTVKELVNSDRMVVVNIYSSLPDRAWRERDLASADARRFTQIESMSLTLHSFKSSKPLRDIL